MYGQADDTDDIEFACEVEQYYESFLGLVNQQLLLEQVLTGIARQAKLWKNNNLNALPFGLSDEAFHLSYIILDIGHLDGWHSRGHFDKSVFHSFTNCRSFSIMV